jgi:hypothetical protein
MTTANEPVAWMSNGKEFYVQKNYCPDFIPLYTHPAKTLTDEEILLEAYYILMREQQRKAQENGDDTRSKG